MTKQAAERATAQQAVDARRARILGAVGRPLHAAGSGADPLPRERIDFLRREAEDLYWNELTWEQLTAEERVVGGHLTELVFPGFLAFIEGLLTQGPRPRPDAVEAILAFLGERLVKLSSALGGGADSEQLVWARAMTSRLVDLVLYRLYQLTPQEREELDQVE
jgi:hypothetical protein